MPIITLGDSASLKAVPSYFDNLTELDAWTLLPKIQGGLDGVTGYKPRLPTQGTSTESKGKLLVCHDYKGGYSESPSSLAYTFNFWDRCETFCYFSHHRVTIPPPGWVDAAHRQGAKMLGVLIFEGNAAADNLQLLIGPKASTSTTGYPVSSHYARVLAELARERGFDGYLMNFEASLRGGAEQARATEAWLSLLVSELKLTVGDHAEVSWYDSVVTNGNVNWQNKLNGRNLPFFLASDTFFSNYNWGPNDPAWQLQYFHKIDPALFQGKPKHPNDIYMGVDVWGRGQYGGGKFNSYKAVEKIDPQNLDLSVALFAPAWTWESEEGNPGFTWDKWWANERKLWVDPGVASGDDQPKPIAPFFPSLPPPDPTILPFFTSFSPGVGFFWFVGGLRTMHKESGWTDVGKQTTLGDQLWPKPSVFWETIPIGVLPISTSTVNFNDAFNGGSSLIVKLAGFGHSAFHNFWVPIQSLALTTGIVYEVQMVYKATCSAGGKVTLGLSVTADREKADVGVTGIGNKENLANYANGWSSISAKFKVVGGHGSGNVAYVGVIVDTVYNDAKPPYEVKIRLGQISVHQAFLTGAQPYDTRLLWADCVAETAAPRTLSLSWDSSISYTSPAEVGTMDPENASPPWVLDRSSQWFPGFAYFNIYMEPRTSLSGPQPSSKALFVGTSGADGMRNRFAVDRDALPEELKRGPLRAFVQGVTDRGVVMAWEDCKFTDID